MIRIALYLLVALAVALQLRRYWRLEGYSWAAFLLETREYWRARWNRWTWRSALAVFAFALSAIASRLLEIAQRPSTPNGPLLRLRIAREWERRDVVFEREPECVKATFGGKVVRIRP